MCMLIYAAHAHATSRLGLWGVNVHVNLPHMQMLRHVLGLGGVNVHVNLPHMHMLRQVLGWGVLTFMSTQS